MSDKPETPEKIYIVKGTRIFLENKTRSNVEYIRADLMEDGRFLSENKLAKVPEEEHLFCPVCLWDLAKNNMFKISLRFDMGRIQACCPECATWMWMR